MTGYDVFLSDGDLLTTINVKTIDEQNNSSLILIGQGIPDYGTAIAQDFVWLMENFAKTTPPVHPIEGQQWYDKANKRMNFYTGAEWRHYAFSESSFSSLFDMASESQDVDFTLIATTAIFVGSDPSKTYCPMFILLKPRGPFTATSPATINLSVATSGDVVASTVVPIITSTQFIPLSAVVTPQMIVGTETLKLNVTVAASGGQLNYDVYVFGMVF